MKIGVVTFYESYDNYGQVLQAYALQKTLCSWGHEAEVIRYGNEHKKVRWLKSSTYRNAVRKQIMKDELRMMLKRWTSWKVMRRQFASFRRKHLRMSNMYYNSWEELCAKAPKCDCYIVGSDQVWALQLHNPNNKLWFLDFGSRETLRIAYAPSFAVNSYPENLHDELSRLLSHFDAVSVRESSGIDICKAHGRDDVKLVLDPTLLADASVYKPIIKNTDKGNYCFVYHVNVYDADVLHWNDCARYNERQGMKTYATFANPKEDVNMEFVDGVEYLYPSINEWLGLISSCTYLLTSSFHGVVFAIVYHRPFIACLRQETTFAGNGRITTLLENLGLQHLMVRAGEEIQPEKILEQPIDWNDVDARLAELRASSADFLQKALSIKKVK